MCWNRSTFQEKLTCSLVKFWFKGLYKVLQVLLNTISSTLTDCVFNIYIYLIKYYNYMRKWCSLFYSGFHEMYYGDDFINHNILYEYLLEGNYVSSSADIIIRNEADK